MVMCCVFLQFGNTPLHNASEQDKVAAVEVLLKIGATINQTNNVSWHIIDYYFIIYTAIVKHTLIKRHT